MKFETVLVQIKDKFPDVYRVFISLVDDLKSLLNNFSADSTGISFGEIKWSKKGLLESVHGIFVRNQIESDTPIHAVYRQLGILAGAGSFTWDTLISESVGYFTRQAANTQIKVFRPGYYLVCFHGIGYGVAAGARGDTTITVNGAVRAAFLEYAGFDEFIQYNCTVILPLIANDVIELPCTTGRTGAGKFCTISIHKLN